MTNEKTNLLDLIRCGDTVRIATPHGSILKGRAVMRGPAGWVLNLGGRYGTPGIATEANIVSVHTKGSSR